MAGRLLQDARCFPPALAFALAWCGRRTWTLTGVPPQADEQAARSNWRGRRARGGAHPRLRAPARWAGHDAVGPDGRRYQIKGRCLLPGYKPGQRVGSIDISKEFDAVLLVLLDGDLDATEIHEADRDAVVAALIRPGSRACNERGALSVSTFRRIGRPVWRRPTARDRVGPQPVGPMSGLAAETNS